MYSNTGLRNFWRRRYSSATKRHSWRATTRRGHLWHLSTDEPTIAYSRGRIDNAKHVAFARFGSPDLYIWFRSVHLLQSSHSNTNVPYTCATTALSKDSIIWGSLSKFCLMTSGSPLWRLSKRKIKTRSSPRLGRTSATSLNIKCKRRLRVSRRI